MPGSPAPSSLGALGALVAELRAAGCVFAEEEAAALAGAAADPGRGSGWLREATARRVAGEPLEHVVGEVVFAGLRLAVGPGVFVPRTRTGLLVDRALAVLPSGGLLVDLCCGVGAVGVVAAARRPDVRVVCADVDAAATAYAGRNTAPYGGRADVVTGDLYDALPPRLRGRVDVVAANAPYVPTDAIADMPREARDHEPRHTLDGGADGAVLHRRIVAGAGAWLRPGGHLLVETSRDQADDLADAFRGGGLVATVAVDDEIGGTVVVGTLAGRVRPAVAEQV